MLDNFPFLNVFFFSPSFIVAEVDANTYWRQSFNSLFHPKQLEEFIVMDVDIVRDQKQGAGAGTRSNKVLLYFCYFCSMLCNAAPLRLCEVPVVLK